MSDTTGTVSWQYDALGRVISVTQPVGSTTKTLQYSYDALGRRVQMVDGEGLVTSYSYDAAGRLVQVSNALMGTTKLFYDGEGKLIRQENGNGTYATFSYDGAGRLVQIEYRRTSDNGLLSRFVYSYDAAGNKVQVQEEVLQPDGSLSVATVSYGYDQIDRLTSEKRTGSYAYWYEYSYDGSGNRLGMVERDGTGNIVGQKSYSYDSGNKLLQEVANGMTTVYQYDLNGNTISKTTGTSQVRYYWDDEDKMVRVEDSVVMNFKVDGLGFRRFKEVVGQYQRWFVYDLGASEVPGLAPLVAEYDGSGNLVAKYHYDGGGLLAMTRNNQSYWYGFEGIGTTRQLMGSQGQVVDAYAFDAWGNEITNPQSQVPNPFKYVGKHGYYLDTESALMLLGVRYYEANLGRFVSLDPVTSGLNWYRYVANPVKGIDPSGLQVEYCPKCGGITYGGYCPNCTPPVPKPPYPPSPKPVPGPGIGFDCFLIPIPPFIICIPSYGYFCGPKTGSFTNEGMLVGKVAPDECMKKLKPSNNPKDEVDKCCMEHDKCYRCHQIGVLDILKSLVCGRGRARPCDDALCDCLRQANCNSSPTPWQCKVYKYLAMKVFCSANANPKPVQPVPPRPLPPPHDLTDSDGDGVPDAYDWTPYP
jgi:RHS repeat-associated protein